ncbi:MAG: methyltransferase domain-containing protein [Deltaproteobacteria bacterium]
MPRLRLPWSHRLRSALEIFQEYRRSNLDNVTGQLALHRKLGALIWQYAGRDLSRLKVLEIGCGQRAVQTMLFTADDIEVTGIDTEIATFVLGPKAFWRIVRVNGLERAAKSLVRHVFFDASFFSQLSRRYGKALPLNGVDVRVMDAACLDFPDDVFDVIFSTRVFEHIADVPGAVAEVNRVLKPDGFAWINIHLFPSLSGGHHKEWTNPRAGDSKKVPPWDHLRENRYPADDSLNRLKLADYRRIFGERLNVVGEELVTEGKEILTASLEMQLKQKGYSREDLLTREAAFLCRKRRSGPGGPGG